MQKNMINLIPYRIDQKRKILQSYLILFTIAVLVSVAVTAFLLSSEMARYSQSSIRNQKVKDEIAQLEIVNNDLNLQFNIFENLKSNMAVINANEQTRYGSLVFLNELIKLIPDQMFIRDFQKSEGVCSLTVFSVSQEPVIRMLHAIDESILFELKELGVLTMVKYKNKNLVKFNIKLSVKS